MYLGKLIFTLALTMFLLLPACSSNKMVPLNPLANSRLSIELEKIAKNRLEDPFISEGMEALEEGDYLLASENFNRALKFVPSNSHLHFLNGLTYHLIANQGDSSQIEYAEVGYSLALQFDASNFWAAYQLGHIYFNKQEYRQAQNWFAYALLFDEKNPDILHALASASYYAQDLKTASTAIGSAEQMDPENPQILQDAVLINAAVSQFDKADIYFGKYEEKSGNAKEFKIHNLKRRLEDWKNVHKNNPKLKLAQSTSDIFGSSLTRQGIKPDRLKSSSKKDGKKKKKLVKKDMVLVDVVIIRSEERRTTRKGVNLLNGLELTFGQTTIFSQTNAKVTGTSAATRTKTTNVNLPSIGLTSIKYSLNIFNDNDDRNEVLARPTLVALDGEKSEFFSGAVIHVPLAGAAGSEGSIEAIPIGVKLDITPKFIDKDTVELNIVAARAFFDSVTTQGATNSPNLQVTKTFISANVAMNFGQTLVLSGLSEKENEKLKDGVPFLQSIPGLQYFFSEENTLDFTKSVIILVTPRKPNYTHGDGSDKIDPQDPRDMDADQAHLKEWVKKRGHRQPAPNLDSVYYHLQNRKLYKEFRTGDVTLETWDTAPRLESMLHRSIEFLYY